MAMSISATQDDWLLLLSQTDATGNYSFYTFVWIFGFRSVIFFCLNYISIMQIDAHTLSSKLLYSKRLSVS